MATLATDLPTIYIHCFTKIILSTLILIQNRLVITHIHSLIQSHSRGRKRDEIFFVKTASYWTNLTSVGQEFQSLAPSTTLDLSAASSLFFFLYIDF